MDALKGLEYKAFWWPAYLNIIEFVKHFTNKLIKYICLNENQIRLLKEIGFDGNKIVKKI